MCSEPGGNPEVDVYGFKGSEWLPIWVVGAILETTLLCDFFQIASQLLL